MIDCAYSQIVPGRLRLDCSEQLLPDSVSTMIHSLEIVTAVVIVFVVLMMFVRMADQWDLRDEQGARRDDPAADVDARRARRDEGNSGSAMIGPNKKGTPK